MADVLFDVRNLFLVGNYAGSINAGEAVNPEEAARKTERDVYVYRSYVAQQQFDIVLDEVSASDSSLPTALKAVRLLALHGKARAAGDEEGAQQAVQQLQQMTGDAAAGANPTLKVVAAAIYDAEGNLDEAFRALHGVKSAEGRALLVQLYLKINRFEEAEKELTGLLAAEPDSTIGQLAAVWLALSSGEGRRAKEAFDVVDELVEKFGATALLLNTLAVCNACMGRFEDAERNLKEALEKDGRNPNTLVNMATVARQLGNTKITNRSLSQLRAGFPQHSFVVEYQKASDEFDKMAAQYKATVEG